MKFKSITFLALGIIHSSIALSNTNDDVSYILKGINQYRLHHLRLPLKLDEHLNAIAYKHSLNMAKHKCSVGHEGFEQRFAQVRHEIAHTSQAAENVAAGYRNLDEVIQGWLHSPGHRQNILGHYKLTGIAIAYDEQHKPYYTQIFAK